MVFFVALTVVSLIVCPRPQLPWAGPITGDRNYFKHVSVTKGKFLTK